MTFLDLTEGDKLAVVVVELHVGPMRQCDALGQQHSSTRAAAQQHSGERIKW
jgi:hypothetical protein